QRERNFESDSDKTTATFDVNASFDISENFLDKDTTSVQVFKRHKPFFYRFFPLKEFPETSS
ncbi:2109_t:CDS:1, partial [Funneliformis geosporum]